MLVDALARAFAALWKKLNNTPGTPKPVQTATPLPPAPKPQPSTPIVPIASAWSCLLPYEYDDAANTSWYCNFDWQKDFIGTDQSRYLGNNNEFVDKLSDANLKYGEKALKPRSEGWDNWLGDQMARCVKSGTHYIELDNTDYALERDRSVVMETYKLANSLGLAVILKNPTARDVVEFGRLTIAGAVFEQGALSPREFAAARKSVVPTMQATWVRHGGNINGQDIPEIASQVREVPGTSVQWGPGEYNGMRIVASNPFQAGAMSAAAPTPAPKPDPSKPNYRSLVAGGFFASPADKSLPVSIRMNNPGAVNGASWERTYPGYVETIETTPGNRTTIFETPENGVAVWWELMRKYHDTGATTVGAIINKYGGGQDYSAYVKMVSEWSGYPASKTIDLNDDAALLPFAKAMFHYEAGRLTPLKDEQIRYGFALARSIAKGTAAPTPQPAAQPPAMLILRGIAGTFAGKDYPRGALDEPSALEYAKRRGYAGRVLDVSGETGPASAQVLAALREFRKDKSIVALYGFSGGGYNVRHILDALRQEERARLVLLVVLGAPGNPKSSYIGTYELVYRTDPPTGHMDGPRALLAEVATAEVQQPNSPLPWIAWAEKEVGFHERGDNLGIERYTSAAHTGAEGDPWCAIFVNAGLETCGIHGTRSAMARSFEHDPNFVKLSGPAFGAITTMWRGSPSAGTGHVFFYIGENENGILALGGNQSDQVCKQYEPRNRIVGYFWPTSVSRPKIGPILVTDKEGHHKGGSET